MVPPFRTICKFLLFLFLCSRSTESQAQQPYTVSYTDSLEATDSLVWLNNDIKIKNSSSSSLVLITEVVFPPFWDIVGKNINTVTISPDQSIILPLNFIRRQQALAKWQRATIQIKNIATGQTSTHYFYLKSNKISRFTVKTDLDEIVATPSTKFVDITAFLRNTGNIDEELTIDITNKLLGIDQTVVKRLDAGEEYIHKLRVRLTKPIRKTLIKENIRFLVKNKAYLYKVQSASTNLYYTGRVAKQNKSSHPTIPLDLETGVMYFANDIAYYWGFRGNMKLKKDNKLNFSYRSRQLGLGNTLERNTFSLEYVTKKWRLYAGELSDLASFYSFGQGLSMTYTSPKKTEVNLSGIIHYRNNPFKSDVFSFYVKYDLKGLNLKHSLAVNLLPGQGSFGIAFANDIVVVNKNNVQFSIKANAGEQHYMYDVDGAPNEKAGLALGYTFFYKWKQLDLFSEYFEASNYYPGVYSGNKTQNHGFMLAFKKVTARVFYQYNYTRNNNIIFIDSVYNTNFFDLDFEKYGLQLGFNLHKNLNIAIGAGKYRQTGAYSNLLPSATYGDMNLNYRKGRYFNIRLNTMNGYNPSFGAKSKAIWISRTNFSINTKIAGLRSFYTRTPIRRASIDTNATVMETYSFAPYVKIVLLKHINTDLSYNFSKSVYDNSLSTFASTSISYINKRNGLELRFMGNIPISNTAKNFTQLANNSMVLSVRKSLEVPFVFRKKFYDLKLVLYKDNNNNSKLDPGEEPLSNLTVNLSDRLFITNSKGIISYQNIEKKFYILDLANVKAPRGYIPGAGSLQFINVDKDVVYEVPYQKGMVITGKVTVTLDQFSEKNFTSERVKITVSDTLNNFYKTLADANGEYYVNVPPGKYKVSLNPEAFTKDLQPVQMFYMVEVGIGKEEATINFEIKEKSRKIRYLNQ